MAGWGCEAKPGSKAEKSCGFEIACGCDVSPEKTEATFLGHLEDSYSSEPTDGL